MEIEKLFQEYKDVCDFVTVYISEAHPKEGWTLGHSQNAELGAKWDVSQPKSTEQFPALGTKVLSEEEQYELDLKQAIANSLASQPGAA